MPNARDRLPPGSGTPGNCPNCGSPDLARWGRTHNGHARWRCGGCRRTCSTTTGTLTAGIHTPDKFRHIIADMAGDQPSSCRCLAARLDLDKTTIWRWRQKIIGMLVRPKAPELDHHGPAETLRVRESRKGSREWLRHRLQPRTVPAPDRPRWVDVDRLGLPLPHPLATYQGTVRLGIGHDLNCRVKVIPALRGSSPAPLLDHSTGEGRRNSGPLPGSTAAPSPQPRHDPTPTRQPADPPLGADLARFIHPFRGPAARYLAGYAAWFAAWLDQSMPALLATAAPSPGRRHQHGLRTCTGQIGRGNQPPTNKPQTPQNPHPHTPSVHPPLTPAIASSTSAIPTARP